MDRLEIKFDASELCDVICNTDTFTNAVDGVIENYNESEAFSDAVIEAIGNNESTIEEIVDRRLESHSVTRLVREVIEDEYGNILREDGLECNEQFIDAVFSVMDGTISRYAEQMAEIKRLKTEVENLKAKSWKNFFSRWF